jgi:hypothetical protein
MNFWVFSSRTLKNIEVAKDRLLWGFWDRETGLKFQRYWRDFIRLYNKIKLLDIVVFQIAGSGDIHGIGVVKETFFDDQTPIWPNEREQNRVLYPWKVSFSTILYSKTPFMTYYTKIEKYVDGYGIGELTEHDFRCIINEVQRKTNIEINMG